MSILAFLSYVIITSITPGPSNILIMNEARRFGFAGSWRFTAGILAGFAVLGILSGVFSAGLYNLIPVIEPYLKTAGAIYLLCLAWQVGLPKRSGEQVSDMKSSFLSGFIFQIINVKSILFFLTVMSAFILPFHHSFQSIVFYLTVAIILGWSALLLWSGFGLVFKKIFTHYDKLFRLVMCLLLVYSAVSIFL
ncbi:LysE family transporter [Cytobacillus firmus]|jgi:cysteine/O-acetylserine efflux protein|uniref:LysE family transporter n=1 Tax=Cytobacillus firmus TaxID=1399 RepID=UPI002163A611|nr:LysE family transporter [Cytobacillus firmus]MCS0670241.1 LysE family transporter [Cytobacillus firmus]